MKDIFDCINSKVKEKKKQSKKEEHEIYIGFKRKQVLITGIENYFCKLPPFKYQVKWHKYELHITITRHFIYKLADIRHAFINGYTSYGFGAMTLEEIEKLYSEREDVLKEIAKQYGCI